MSQKGVHSYQKGSLRRRVLAFAGAMVLVSLLSSTFNLYRITEVNRLLEAINHVSVPLGRLFTQMQSDAEVFQRELDRGLGYSHWKDSHWKPRPAPHWIVEVLQNEMSRVGQLIANDSEWTTPEARAHWEKWSKQVSEELNQLATEASRLYEALVQKDEAAAAQIYPQWITSMEDWKRQLQWGAAEYERSLRQNFATAENRVAELRTGLEVILVIVAMMSLLLVWLGERALRPLVELTSLARDITRRGLRKEDKSLLPEISLSRSDEVSRLAREFHSMATALLEREKTVESQKHRLQDQNRLLREMGELNENILKSIESVLIVTDLEGIVTQCNPGSVRWLGRPEEEIIGSNLKDWPKLSAFVDEASAGSPETWKLGPAKVEDRVYGGYVMPLRQEGQGAKGAIIVLDDLTEEVSLQERLRQAENLAAVGRMSAQVAHEVRNPLHSIGLEAEMAIEMAARTGDKNLKQSLQSILNSVDRLQKITENYLKLSRLSDGQKAAVDLTAVLNSVLVTYAPVSEVQGVTVECKQEPFSHLVVWADRDLLEQVLGNLFRNSLQALESWIPVSGEEPRITWWIGNTESGRIGMRIEDNGPGIPVEVQNRLFTPFVTTRAQGTGLGLSFIKKVLEDHGGRIVNLERPAGSGACFEMTLPIFDRAEEVFEEVTHV